MKQSVAIIGGGPAALLLAAFLDSEQFAVTIYEQNKTVGRKFLVAGSGGFNLTHAEPLPKLLTRYTPTDTLQEALHNFSNEDLREWLASIGIPTFVGTSKRVYPEAGIKPIAVLQAILQVLENKGVDIRPQHHWTGWTADGQLQFENGQQLTAEHTVFALGGGSWKVTGSDGSWLPHFSARGIPTLPFRAANCAVAIPWSADFLAKTEGQALKNISLRCGELEQSGELVITQSGLEGNAVYALSPALQNELDEYGHATIWLNLKPMLSAGNLRTKMQAASKQRPTQILKKAVKLSPVQLALVQAHVSKATYLHLPKLAERLQALPLRVTALAPIDEAISTTGGIARTAVDDHFALRQLPRHYCIGEMLDWNAPTGGYLLQGCFSMGVALARWMNT